MKQAPLATFKGLVAVFISVKPAQSAHAYAVLSIANDSTGIVYICAESNQPEIFCCIVKAVFILKLPACLVFLQ
ncbi:MAG: hypothetical protein ACKO96_00445 [Flammeovirgaceae bacterium]